MAEQKYRVIGKFIYRASTQEVTMGTRPDGSPNVVRQPGPMQRLEVGTILDDVTPDELAAIGDRLELVTEEGTPAEPASPGEEPAASEGETRIRQAPGRAGREGSTR